MNATKLAIACVWALTVTLDDGPSWWRLIKALVRLAAIGYLVWYFLRGADPIERRTPPKCQCHPERRSA